MIKNKITFWVKVAGWSGLVSASAALSLYQMSHNLVFLISLVAIVLFSAYLLSTIDNPHWKNASWLFKVMIFSLIFISILPSIFIGIAYFKARK